MSLMTRPKYICFFKLLFNPSCAVLGVVEYCFNHAIPISFISAENADHVVAWIINQRIEIGVRLMGE